jgi:hypothetical protein
MLAAVVVAKDILILERVRIKPLFPWAGAPGTSELMFATRWAALCLRMDFLPPPCDKGGKSWASSSSRGATGIGGGPLVVIGAGRGGGGIVVAVTGARPTPALGIAGVRPSMTSCM